SVDCVSIKGSPDANPIGSCSMTCLEVKTSRTRIMRKDMSRAKTVLEKRMAATERATSFPKDQIKVLLLENVHATAREHFAGEGYQVEALPSSLSPEELKRKVADVHILGIRSKTQVPAEALGSARRLLIVGCFCIGTNQVDLDATNRRG